MLRLLLKVALVAAISASQSAQAQQGRPFRLVVLGDSLSAGFLLPSSAAFPAVLERSLQARGLPVLVTNAGVSGETAAGGLARLERDVPDGTDGVLLELGANDKLQRHDPATTRATLAEIVRRLRARRIRVLLAGIRFNDPAGAPYNGIFPEVARQSGAAYYPDFYAGLTAEPRFTLFDNTHPSSEGVAVMVARILPTVERFVQRRNQDQRRR